MPAPTQNPADARKLSQKVKETNNRSSNNGSGKN